MDLSLVTTAQLREELERRETESVQSSAKLFMEILKDLNSIGVQIVDMNEPYAKFTGALRIDVQSKKIFLEFREE